MAGTLPGWFGLELLRVEHGLVAARLEIAPEHLAPNGYLHAGTVVTLADSCCGMGCMASMPEDRDGFTTVELKTNFLRTARTGSPGLPRDARPCRAHDAGVGRDGGARGGRPGRWHCSAAPSTCSRTPAGARSGRDGRARDPAAPAPRRLAVRDLPARARRRDAGAPDRARRARTPRRRGPRARAARLRLGRRGHRRHDARQPRGVPPPAARARACCATSRGASLATHGARHRAARAGAARAGRRADDRPPRRRARVGARRGRARAAGRRVHRGRSHRSSRSPRRPATRRAGSSSTGRKDDAITASLVRRAEAAGYSAIVVTLDTIELGVAPARPGHGLPAVPAGRRASPTSPRTPRSGPRSRSRPRRTCRPPSATGPQVINPAVTWDDLAVAARA